MSTEAHLTPSTSDHGFNRLPEIETTDGGKVAVYESSAALGPHIWLHADPGPAFVGGGFGKAPCRLTLDAARKLAEQLLWLVDNHYQERSA